MPGREKNPVDRTHTQRLQHRCHFKPVVDVQSGTGHIAAEKLAGSKIASAPDRVKIPAHARFPRSRPLHTHSQRDRGTHILHSVPSTVVGRLRIVASVLYRAAHHGAQPYGVGGHRTRRCSRGGGQAFCINPFKYAVPCGVQACLRTPPLVHVTAGGKADQSTLTRYCAHTVHPISTSVRSLLVCHKAEHTHGWHSDTV